jgi:hypothetical protein
MTPEIKRILLQADCETGCESPVRSKIDWQIERNRVEEVRKEIEEITGKKLYLDENVQDASFLTDIGVYRDAEKTQATTRIYFVEIAVRFSNFGNLVTIWSADENLHAADYDVSEMIKILNRHGYVYVSASDLGEIYDGKNRVLRDDKTTWWTRYFDYL